MNTTQFFSFWTPEQHASAIDQTCQGPVGQAHAQALAQRLGPQGQAVADFLQWHITGVPKARLALSGRSHRQGTQWTLRAEATPEIVAQAEAWAHQDGHERFQSWSQAA
jgi:hypothetical protein